MLCVEGEAVISARRGERHNVNLARVVQPVILTAEGHRVPPVGAGARSVPAHPAMFRPVRLPQVAGVNRQIEPLVLPRAAWPATAPAVPLQRRLQLGLLVRDQTSPARAAIEQGGTAHRLLQGVTREIRDSPSRVSW